MPGKNLALLNGRPMLAYTCEAARASGVLAAVYVNTDCPQIAAAAEGCGVRCPVLRPAALAADDSSTRDANCFLLNFLAGRGERYDAVVVLQPTSPLRAAADIQEAWRIFEDNFPCAVVSVSAVAPESWLGRVHEDGRFEALVGPGVVHALNGAIYIHTWDDYLGGHEARKTMAYCMPAARGVDIDTAEDLRYAEFLLRDGTYSARASG